MFLDLWVQYDLWLLEETHILNDKLLYLKYEFWNDCLLVSESLMNWDAYMEVMWQGMHLNNALSTFSMLFYSENKIIIL